VVVTGDTCNSLRGLLCAHRRSVITNATASICTLDAAICQRSATPLVFARNGRGAAVEYPPAVDVAAACWPTIFFVTIAGSSGSLAPALVPIVVAERRVRRHEVPLSAPLPVLCVGTEFLSVLPCSLVLCAGARLGGRRRGRRRRAPPSSRWSRCPVWALLLALSAA
jgi:hypothetical protein